MSRGAAALASAALVLGAGALAGCGLGGVLQNPFRQAAGAGTVDAHVVHRVRAGCALVVARTRGNGYSILAPAEGSGYAEGGIFEGPVREGRSVFRYYTPQNAQRWDDPSRDVPVDAVAVRLDLRAAVARFDAQCPPPASPDPSVPRVPGGLGR